MGGINAERFIGELLQSGLSLTHDSGHTQSPLEGDIFERTANGSMKEDHRKRKRGAAQARTRMFLIVLRIECWQVEWRRAKTKKVISAARFRSISRVIKDEEHS